MTALDGLVVLDFTWNLPGPYASRLLRQQGATVVKVEPPRGDPGRNVPPLFERLNRGKQGVVLDLASDADRGRLEGLVRGADVLIEGFRPGVLARLGCGWDQARAWNPRLIYCSITAFGQDGPARDAPAHDLNLQALLGTAWMERDGRGRPRETVLPVADYSAAMAAVAAIGFALHERERTGEGTWLDVSMVDALQDWTEIWAEGADLLSDVKARGPLGRAAAAGPWFATHRRRMLYALPHYGLFRCLDGKWLAIGIVDEGRFWRSLCRTLGLRGVGRLPLPARAALGPALRKLLAARLATRSRDHWLTALQEADVPVTPVLTAQEAPRHPWVERRAGRALPGSLADEGEVPTLPRPKQVAGP